MNVFYAIFQSWFCPIFEKTLKMIESWKATIAFAQMIIPIYRWFKWIVGGAENKHGYAN